MANAINNFKHRVSAALRRSHPASTKIAQPIEHRIGRHILTIPPAHALPTYKASWPLYDGQLSLFVDVLSEHTVQDLTIIDIGANVGDTAAAFSSSRDIHTLCIEGD